jgi:hypothetical protein
MPERNCSHRSVSALTDQPPGDDPDNPYTDVDVSKLPSWWQEAINEFKTYNLRPYRPARFSDNILVYPLVIKLENEFNSQITIVGFNVTSGDEWTIQVDGEPIVNVEKLRDPAGYTIYELTAYDFINTTMAAVGESLSNERVETIISQSQVEYFL